MCSVAEYCVGDFEAESFSTLQRLGCRLVGCVPAGATTAQVIAPFERQRDREMDAEMRKRRKKDPAFARMQRKTMRQRIEEFGEPEACAAPAGGCHICLARPGPPPKRSGLLVLASCWSEGIPAIAARRAVLGTVEGN